MSASVYLADVLANSVAAGNVFASLAIGDPGPNGTDNAAAETSRQQVTFGSSSNGIISLTNTPTWNNVAATETVSHVALWDDASAGNCLGSGAMSVVKELTAGDNFSLTTVTFAVV